MSGRAPGVSGPEGRDRPADDLPADDLPVDELPVDLDATRLVGPTVFPDVARRRIAGAIYLLGAAACAAGALAVGYGLGPAAVVLAVAGVYHVLAGWPLRVDETQALVIATRAIGFPVGHASAQLAWYGWRSRPVWRVLCYSADDPPSRRGLVELDGLDGHVMGSYDEPNPEDWSAFAPGAPPEAGPG